MKGGDARLGFLRGLRPFSACSAGELRAVGRLSTVVTRPAGSVLAREGVVSREVLIVASGLVLVTKQGRPDVVLRAGDCFGDADVLTRSRSSATLVALNDVELVVVSYGELAACWTRFRRTAAASSPRSPRVPAASARRRVAMFAPVRQHRRPRMATRLVNLCFDANDPVRLARFWAGALGWEIHDETHDEVGVLPTDGTRFILVFLPVPEPKTAKNPLHLDLVAESADHQLEIVDRLTGLGARHVDIGQGPDADHEVLTDPEGNEFCVVVRGEFLADTGFLGAVVFEPANPATGYFWGEAVGWPVVYDRDGDVAIRAPDGRGPFITFGPPGTAKSGKNRLHLDVAPAADDDQEAEVGRLIALGARRVDIGQGDVPWVVLADPDGNEFCVLTPR